MSPRSLPETPPPAAAAAEPTERTIVGNVVYATYALALFTGFTALIGVVIAYLNQDAVRGTWLDSHSTWQIRTFWYGLAFQAVGWLTVWILIGWAILAIGYLYFVWRVAKGWVRLANHRPVENPTSFF